MAGQADDVVYGNIALKRRLVTKDLLQRAMMFKQAQAPERSLGEILVEYGFLTLAHHREIVAYLEKIEQIRAKAGRPPGWRPPSGSGPVLAPPSPPNPASWGRPGAAEAFDAGGGGGPAVALGPTPNPDQDPLLGEVVAGCQLNARLGAGAMATVYLAHHTSLKKDVVVKILSEECANKPRTVERFFREARAAARLEHPNVVTVYDVGKTETGLHYMVMQYVDGTNLEEKMQAEGRQSLAEATRLCLEIARGLQAAHQTGVVHRDVKAENVLLTRSGTAKVTDFGLAKDTSLDPLTMEGTFIGTPIYMAPEIGRQQADARADIYSLGLTFYYLLTGVQPLREFGGMDILRALAHERIKPPEEHFPDLPDAYRHVLGRMLVKDRDKRPRDMAAVVRDLEALQAGLPVSDPQGPTLWPPRPGSAPLPAPLAQTSPAAEPGGRRWLIPALVVAALLGVAALALALWLVRRG